MKIKHFIKIKTPVAMNKESRSLFFNNVKDALAGKVSPIKSTNEEGEKTVTKMFNKRDGGEYVYIIPLSQNATEDELEAVVDVMMNNMNVGNFSIESSTSVSQDAVDSHLDEESFGSMAEQFSKKVHENWLNERMENGWRYGELRDDRQKTHPLIKNWNQLSETEKNIDPELFKQFVEILKANGFKISKK